jgi:hypothetical protein
MRGGAVDVVSRTTPVEGRARRSSRLRGLVWGSGFSLGFRVSCGVQGFVGLDLGLGFRVSGLGLGFVSDEPGVAPACAPGFRSKV